MKNLRSLIFGWSSSKPKTAYAMIIESINSYCGPLDGRRVLEVGCAVVPDFLAEIDDKYSLKEAIGINLVAENKDFSPTLRTIRGDVRKMDNFADNYFDLIISSSVFEHLHNFDVALEEMCRVLQPGGFLFSHFGPIWSGSYGHHLWIDDGTRSITYHTLDLPPYCHLLMTQAEVQDLVERWGETKSKEIAEYVFRSDCQNQLMFSDYDRIVSESRFERIFLNGYDHQFNSQYRFNRNITAEQLIVLNRKYPSDQDKFMYDGVVMLLRKPLE